MMVTMLDVWLDDGEAVSGSADTEESAVCAEPKLHQVVSYRLAGSDEWNRAEVVSRGGKVGGVSDLVQCKIS